MQARRPLIHGILVMALLVSASSSAQFRADPNLKGSGLDANYGTYAPGGDCKREPRITVDDSGFTFRDGKHDMHPPTVATDAGHFGRQDTLLAFLPFPAGVTQGESGLEASDPGPVLMALDTQAFTLTLSASNPGVPLTPLQEALIKNSPYARCGAQGATSHATGLSAATAANTDVRKINISQPADQIKPNAAQTAAIRRAAAADIKEFNHPEQGGYVVAQADLNDDGRPDLLVQYDDMAFCGSHGCSGVIVMATADGYSTHAIGLPNFYGEIDILAATHGGMHDLRFGDSPVWSWNGSEYAVDEGGSRAAATTTPAPQSAAGGPGWQTRAAAGRTLAMAVATDSVIKSMSLFCDKGRPVLAALVKARPPTGPILLTFEFGGHAVNVPMGLGNHEGTLLLSDPSISDLPKWLARSSGVVQLRINGGMQGQVTLANSTAATQAALSSCYHY